MRIVVVVALLCGAVAPVNAHAPSDAHVMLAVEGDRLVGRVEVAIRDLDAALPIDDGDGAITWRELAAAAPAIARYVDERLAVASDGTACPLVMGPAGLRELSSGTYWSQPIVAQCAATPRVVTLRYSLLFDLDARHRGLVHLGDHVLVARDRSPLQIDLGEASSGLTFIREGIWHIWIGFDHVLFLICLLLPAVYPSPRRLSRAVGAAGSFRDVAIDVLQIVTAFTVAHSITLALSAVGFVQLPSRVVETAIALSVVAAAVNNLARVIDARWAIAFALGLLHGFGFSSVLLDLGLPAHQLASALLGFNLGVELGQLAIVLVILPLLYLVRRTFAYRLLLWGGSSAAAVIGLLWVYERVA